MVGEDGFGWDFLGIMSEEDAEKFRGVVKGGKKEQKDFQMAERLDRPQRAGIAKSV